MPHILLRTYSLVVRLRIFLFISMLILLLFIYFYFTHTYLLAYVISAVRRRSPQAQPQAQPAGAVRSLVTHMRSPVTHAQYKGSVL